MAKVCRNFNKITGLGNSLVREVIRDNKKTIIEVTPITIEDVNETGSSNPIALDDAVDNLLYDKFPQLAKMPVDDTINVLRDTFKKDIEDDINKTSTDGKKGEYRWFSVEDGNVVKKKWYKPKGETGKWVDSGFKVTKTTKKTYKVCVNDGSAEILDIIEERPTKLASKEDYLYSLRQRRLHGDFDYSVEDTGDEWEE